MFLKLDNVTKRRNVFQFVTTHIELLLFSIVVDSYFLAFYLGILLSAVHVLPCKSGLRFQRCLSDVGTPEPTAAMA